VITKSTEQFASFTAQVLCRAEDVLGEGPLWDHRSGHLLWIDIIRGIVHSWSAADGLRELVRAELLIGSIALTGQADLLLATSQGLVRWIASSGDLQLLLNPIAGQGVRFNDGRVDAAGRFWVGTMALDPSHYADSVGTLYRFDPDGRLYVMEEGLTISNGLDWSPDGRTLYLTDTMRRLIYAYEFDVHSGTLGRRRIFLSTAEKDGHPDGLVVDAGGDVWSACFGGHGICRYDAGGHLLEKVCVPVSCPTALTFGGADCATAFVTTSRHVLEADHQEADAGALLCLALPTRGRPAAVFGGGLS
jgi:sugar lactone lactonase YvrE